ncbi:hypothetical protein Anas_07365, partial [Armadillidium nasatum]
NKRGRSSLRRTARPARGLFLKREITKINVKISVLCIKISVLYIKICVLYIKISASRLMFSTLKLGFSTLKLVFSTLKISVLYIKISVLYIKISVLHIKISVLYIKISASRLVFSTLKLCIKISVLYIKISASKVSVLYIKISASRLVFSTLKLVFSTSKVSVLYIKISASRLVFSTLKLVFSTSISVLHIKISVLYIKISASTVSQVFDGGDDGRFITNTESTVAHTVLSHLEGVKEPFSTGRGARPGNDCGNRDISQCTELLEVLTRKEIGVLLSGLQCIDNYTLRCLNPQHRSYFNELYAGTIRVIKDLCNTRGQYQQGLLGCPNLSITKYIRHAPCMRQVHPKYNRCSETYHEKTAKLNKVNSAVVQFSETERRRNVITLCCSFQEYLQCSEQIVYETCGNVTAQFTRQFLNRMAGPIVQTKCSRYEPGSYICLTAANLSPTLCPPSVVVTFILVGFSFSTNLLRIY